LTERQLAKLKESPEREPERVVFSILRDSKCSDYAAEFPWGSSLTMTAEDRYACRARKRQNSNTYCRAIPR
jgi:hypothetical protein